MLVKLLQLASVSSAPRTCVASLGTKLTHAPWRTFAHQSSPHIWQSVTWCILICSGPPSRSSSSRAYPSSSSLACVLCAPGGGLDSGNNRLPRTSRTSLLSRTDCLGSCSPSHPGLSGSWLKGSSWQVTCRLNHAQYCPFRSYPSSDSKLDVPRR